uniref:60Kd inner membrane protein, putative n=1 Tax=Theileria annulata TaxID=5874 RepID=A0A3B0NB47_THEAN
MLKLYKTVKYVNNNYFSINNVFCPGNLIKRQISHFNSIYYTSPNLPSTLSNIPFLVKPCFVFSDNISIKYGLNRPYLRFFSNLNDSSIYLNQNNTNTTNSEDINNEEDAEIAKNDVNDRFVNYNFSPDDLNEKVYNIKNKAGNELIEELEEDLKISGESLGVEELFEIPDYHQYLMTRIMDLNGNKRSILQRFLPVEYVQQMFLTVHDCLNLSWSATIFLITLFFKLLLLPVWSAAERSRRLNAVIMPEVVKLQEKAKLAFSTKNHELARETQLKIFELTKRNSFVKGILVQIGATMVQGLMFGTVYGGLRLFAIDPNSRPDFTYEPCLWLDSLCLPDPYYILPTIFGILMTFVFEHNISLSISSNLQSNPGSELEKLKNRQKNMKIISRIGIILITLYGCSMPSSAFFYLIPSFLFQTIVRYLCNKFNIARLLNIPTTPIKRSNT